VAELTLFGYRPGRSILHELDVRLKLVMLCLISLSMVKAGLYSSMIYGLVLAIAFKTAQIPMTKTVHQLRFFLLLLGMVFLSRALSEPGDTLLGYGDITITREGVFSGFSVALKFLFIMITGLVFSSTTSISDLKNGIQWILRPIPFLPEQRVTVVVGLALNFIPIIFKQAGHISDARRARCGDENRNPIKKTAWLVLPLLKKTFQSADHIALAMASRSYTDDRTCPQFHSSGKEPVFLAGTLAMTLCLLFF
jgi:energy-coupling factor transporter transmembrane protein EcfT